jgi:hypothetical protein
MHSIILNCASNGAIFNKPVQAVTHVKPPEETAQKENAGDWSKWKNAIDQRLQG